MRSKTELKRMKNTQFRIYYFDYFLSREYFETKRIRDKYTVFCDSEFKLGRLPKLLQKKKTSRILFQKFTIKATALRHWFSSQKTLKNETVLLFAIDNFFDLYKAINGINYRSSNVYLWLWNPIGDGYNSKLFQSYLRELEVKVITFDKADSRRNGYRYHNQIFNEELIAKYGCYDRTSIEKSDLFFIGVDKGRLSQLEKIELECQKFGLSVNFRVVDSEKEHRFYSDKISYRDYFQLLVKSKIVVDLCQEGQEGLTVRALEATFLGKKLITNNRDIKNYDFYHENNILVLDHNTTGSDIALFLNLEHRNIDQSILRKYTLDTFLEVIWRSD